MERTEKICKAKSLFVELELGRVGAANVRKWIDSVMDQSLTPTEQKIEKIELIREATWDSLDDVKKFVGGKIHNLSINPLLWLPRCPHCGKSSINH